jgi:uncharacterized protein YbaR (Trm112 family)
MKGAYLVTPEDNDMIKKELLDILACPKCKGAVQIEDDGSTLICYNCRLAFPIKDDIPIMLIDEASQLPEKEKK